MSKLKQFVCMVVWIAVLCPLSASAQPKVPKLYHPYLLPVVYDGQLSRDIPPFHVSNPLETQIQPNPLFPTEKAPLDNPPTISLLSNWEKYIYSIRREAFFYLITHNPERIQYFEHKLDENVEKVAELQSNNFFDQVFTPQIDVTQGELSTAGVYVAKRKYWKFSGVHDIKFSQSYISKNWYSGGLGNMNLTNVHTVNANYAKNKFSVTNLLEWRMSFYTNPNDTVRSFKLGDDVVHTYSTVELKAFGNKWSYLYNLDMRTQLFRNYLENSNDYVAALLSPLQVSTGLGMKYLLVKTSKADKYKNLNLSVDMTPLSAKLLWVSDTEGVDPRRFGIDVGESRVITLGSSVTANMKWNFNRQVSWKSRMHYFSNYESSQVEWENTIDLALSRFFTTTIYLYGRYDDTPGITRDSDLGFLQLRQQLTFGFRYQW